MKIFGVLNIHKRSFRLETEGFLAKSEDCKKTAEDRPYSLSSDCPIIGKRRRGEFESKRRMGIWSEK